MKLPFRRAPHDVPPAAGPEQEASEARFETVARTHVGTVRALNEDRILTLEDHALWVVADGMGGHRNGDIAAQTVVDEIARAVPDSGDLLQAAAQRANRSLWDGSRVARQGVAGATMVALLMRQGSYECHWAGDSQIWLLREGQLRRLTRDHSLVEELVAAGALLEAERKAHPQAHVITRAIGVAESVSIDVEIGTTKPGDIFLLCSDGLTGAVAFEDIQLILGTEPAESAADLLLEKALANRASDNVSFIIIRLIHEG